MGDNLPLQICVGSRHRFESWCQDTLGVHAWQAEKDWQAVHIAGKHDIPKLWGLQAPLALVVFADDHVEPDLASYVEAVVDQENWIASLTDRRDD